MKKVRNSQASGSINYCTELCKKQFLPEKKDDNSKQIISKSCWDLQKKHVSIPEVLTLIWSSSLGVPFEVGVAKLPPPPPPTSHHRLRLVRIMLET